jgi:hypothetical protein
MGMNSGARAIAAMAQHTLARQPLRFGIQQRQTNAQRCRGASEGGERSEGTVISPIRHEARRLTESQAALSYRTMSPS